MIHIFTLHFGDDKWSKLQLDSIKKHMKLPYKLYSIYSHMSESKYEYWREHYDVFLVKEKGKHIHKNGNYHLTDGHRDIIPYIIENSNENDIFIRLDSDALLVGDIDVNFVDKIKKHKFIAVREPQHEWDLNYITPHPSFYAFPIKLLKMGLGTMLSEIIDDGHSNWWGGVVNWLNENKINWLPLNRTNKLNLHPLFFAIYDDIIYHHWAGSRDMITRPDRKLSSESGVSIEKIKDDNHKLNEKIMEQLNVQIDTFISFLKGKKVETN